MTLPELFISANKMTDERFMPIKKFETRFWISDFGRIVSHDHRKNTVNFLHPPIDTQGYYQVQLRMKPKNRKVRIHTLVAEHFYDKKNKDEIFVNHKNGIKLDNHFENIEWITPAGNCIHAIQTGLHDLKGENHPNSKLTIGDVKEMRNLYKTGLTHKKIAEKFGVTRRQAGDVINGVNWGWLT